MSVQGPLRKFGGSGRGSWGATDSSMRASSNFDRSARLLESSEMELQRCRGRFSRKRLHTSPSHKDPVRNLADDIFLHAIEAVVCPLMARIAAS